MNLQSSESINEARKAVGVTPADAQSWAYTFGGLVGARRVVTDPAACAAFSVTGVTPSAVIYPRAAEDVAAILSIASSWGLAVIPLRNGTKVGMGNVPLRYDIALCLKDLNQVWQYEPDDLTIGVEAGMKFGDLQRYLSRRGLWLPLDPPGGPRASVGGILAANASGPLRIRYGGPRDMVLGMKFATADGKIIKTGGRVVKNVAGYDLSKLMIGSFGTLGVILEVNFKLFPLPLHRQTFVFPATGLEIFRELRRAILASPLTPLRMVLLNPPAQALATGLSPDDERGSSHEFWVEVGGSAAVLCRASQILGAFGARAGCEPRKLDEGVARECWDRIADYTTWASQPERDLWVLKATLPIASSEKFLEAVYQETEQERWRVASFAQTGTGTVLLSILAAKGDAKVATFVSRLRTIASRLQGALTVLEGPTSLKQHVDSWGPPATDIVSMRKLKQTLDPNGILSPGRFVGGL
ncbi:MAG TPA: FAD-binding oxidoreductase [Terriglobia bacterium]|nr:FAD-binding oxidoreductase [Terriglobia bacterium]